MLIVLLRVFVCSPKLSGLPHWKLRGKGEEEEVMEDVVKQVETVLPLTTVQLKGGGGGGNR